MRDLVIVFGALASVGLGAAWDWIGSPILGWALFAALCWLIYAVLRKGQ